MEFGIGMFGDLSFDKGSGKFMPAEQRLAEIVEEIKLADELGIDVIALGEHHRPDYAIASTEVVLAAVSTVTKHIKLASGVTVLSSTDPIKVYQDYATLDLLSNGRAEIMAGRGSFTESFPLFGYDLWDYDELFSEKLELLLTLNQNEEITWQGKFRAPINKQTVYPRPLGGRKLPVWIAVGGTAQSVQRAGTLGLPMTLAIIGGMPEQFSDVVEYYKRVYKEAGHNQDDFQLAVHSHTFVADSSGTLVSDYYPVYAEQMDRVGKTRGWPPYTKLQFEGGMSRDGALFMGSPEQVAEKIARFSKLFGLTRFIGHMDIGAPNHASMMKSIELYATKVVPLVKKELGEA